MLTTSKDANPNYLCKIVQLKNLRKHSNADRLQVVDINFQTVITGMDAKDGDVYVFFPLESKISSDFLSHTNSFRHSELNRDKEAKGFFEDNCRVRAVKLRGEKSMGYIVPAEVVFEWANYIYDPMGEVNVEFDTINGIKLIEKYQIPTKGASNTKANKKPKVSRIIEGQVHLHVDTENLRNNSHKVNPEDTISITYKTHGTSWWVSNVLVKRRLGLLERLLRFFGVKVRDTEYDLVYGSRKVVKNAELKDPKAKDHFYGYDLWEDIKNEVGEFIPKGWTLYGEMLGYDRNGGMIQKDFDYGCTPDGPVRHKLEVYRITNTTPDGLVTELSYPEIKEFCDRVGLTASKLFYYGTAMGWFSPRVPESELYLLDERFFNERFVKYLEEEYNDKNCFMCVNKVPEEGIVVRKESLFQYEAYKLKSFAFLEKETKQLDSGESDIESEN